MTRVETTTQLRMQRRAARREANRTQILDAAEQVFARVGVHNGSMREIAAEAGFSSAAIYLFFENRQDLVAQTLMRRVDELVALIADTIDASSEPLSAMHTIVDETLAFHDRRRDFWTVLTQVRSGTTMLASELGVHADEADERFLAIEAMLTRLVRSGQRKGTIRRGNPRVLARFYMVLNNEYIITNLNGDGASPAEFHAFLDDAFAPARPG